MIQAFKKHHTPLHMNVELPTIEDIKQFVRMENGVALVPLIAVEHEIASGELVHVPCPRTRHGAQAASGLPDWDRAVSCWSSVPQNL